MIKFKRTILAACILSCVAMTYWFAFASPFHSANHAYETARAGTPTGSVWNWFVSYLLILLILVIHIITASSYATMIMKRGILIPILAIPVLVLIHSLWIKSLRSSQRELNANYAWLGYVMRVQRKSIWKHSSIGLKTSTHADQVSQSLWKRFRSADILTSTQAQ